MRLIEYAALLVLPVGTLAAQQDSTDWRSQLAPNARVRVTLAPPGTEPLVGTLTVVTRDSLVLRTGTGTNAEAIHTVMVPSIIHLELSAGRMKAHGRGAARGALIGAGIVAVLSYISWRPCTGFCMDGPKSAGANGALGAVFGGLIGAIVGALHPPFDDRWRIIIPTTSP